MDFNDLLMSVLVFAPPTILAITLHEAAHGYVAKYFGDTTAWMLGRVTLNPVKHNDVMADDASLVVLGQAEAPQPPAAAPAPAPVIRRPASAPRPTYIPPAPAPIPYNSPRNGFVAE